MSVVRAEDDNIQRQFVIQLLLVPPWSSWDCSINLHGYICSLSLNIEGSLHLRMQIFFVAIDRDQMVRLMLKQYRLYYSAV